MKKIIWTNNTDVRLGFEVECIVRHGSFHTQFNEAMRPLRSKLSIGSDGSIQCGNYEHPLEIRTKPLPPKEALELLKTIFDNVNKFGFTNASCGLHVNISSARRAKMRNFNPLPFLSSSLWNEILRKFNRRGNTYCKPILRLNSSRVSKVHAFKSFGNVINDKYRCVNLCNFGNGMSKSSRVEIRGFGNANYTQKFPNIEQFVKRIERLFKLSCGNIPLTRRIAV
jgi:hypothetical protein